MNSGERDWWHDSESGSGEQSRVERVAEISALPIPLDELLGRSLDALLSLSWLALLPKGRVVPCRVRRQGGDYLHLVAGRNLGPIGTLCAKIRFGQCFCGLAAVTREPVHAATSTSAMLYASMAWRRTVLATSRSCPGTGCWGCWCVICPTAPSRAVSSPISCSVGPVCWVGDRTARQERQLAETNRELNFQTATLGEHAIVSVTDRRGAITYVNRSSATSVVYTREELIGQNHRLLKSGHHPAAFL